MTSNEINEVHTPEAAVAQGAALLDEHRPGWERTVRGAMTAGLFEMSAWESCMVGTLELVKVDPQIQLVTPVDMIAFNGLSISAYGDEARWIGFMPLKTEWDTPRDWWSTLDRLWRAEVEKRTGESLGVET